MKTIAAITAALLSAAAVQAKANPIMSSDNIIPGSSYQAREAALKLQLAHQPHGSTQTILKKCLF